jgi:hypothetical protein
MQFSTSPAHMGVYKHISLVPSQAAEFKVGFGLSDGCDDITAQHLFRNALHLGLRPEPRNLTIAGRQSTAASEKLETGIGRIGGRGGGGRQPLFD